MNEDEIQNYVLGSPASEAVILHQLQSELGEVPKHQLATALCFAVKIVVAEHFGLRFVIDDEEWNELVYEPMFSEYNKPTTLQNLDVADIEGRQGYQIRTAELAGKIVEMFVCSIPEMPTDVEDAFRRMKHRGAIEFNFSKRQFKLAWSILISEAERIASTARIDVWESWQLAEEECDIDEDADVERQ